jgi:hypothetical protein
MQDPAFKEKCLENRLSTIDALLSFTCNEASKRAPIIVPLDRFSDALRDAMDVTAAYTTRPPPAGTKRTDYRMVQVNE